ncbi:MAG TPA: nuclear transport factor 2 family protein [Xanthomonadales bacterium]|nr:nuclear transport factor 2 family protein [Xanthomonadales bacterium]
MRRILLLAVLSIVPGLCAAETAAPDEAALKTLLTEFLDGAGRNDAAVHDRFWADDLIYTRSAGVRMGKAELMEGVRSAPPPEPEGPKSVFTAEDVRVHQYGDAAVVAFRLVGTTTDGKTTEVAKFLNTGTFVKRGGRWQAVAWQSTRVPDEAAEPAK